MSANEARKSATWVPPKAEMPARFLMFGLLNTVATFAVFVALGLIIVPSLAYGAAFLIGLFIVYKFSNKWVFKGKESIPTKVGYVLWYLAVFALGQTLIAVFDPNGLGDLLLVSIFIIGVNLPLTYIGGKLIFRT